MGRQFTRLVALSFLFAVSASLPANELPKVQGHILQLPDQPAGDLVSSKANGELSVTGMGRETSGHMDHGTFAGFRTDALNFTFIARVKEFGPIVPGTRIGIIARQGLEGNDRAVSLRIEGTLDGARVQWRSRHHVVANTHQGSKRAFLDGTVPGFDQKNAAGLWLKMVRRYPYVDLAASSDGKTWEPVPYTSLLLAEKIWVGVQVAGGGDAKTPLTATFDRLSFNLDNGLGTSIDNPATFKETMPPARKDAIYFAKINLGSEGKPMFATAYAIVPQGLAPKDIRAYLWTPGSKEIATADGGTLPFRREDPKSPSAGLRLPADFDKDEGVYFSDKLAPEHAMLAHYGIVRLGTLHDAYDDSVKRLAEVSKIPQLRNLPFVATGASAAGGRASAATRKQSERAVACAPTLIGAAGVEEVQKFPHVPFLHIVGSKDGTHLNNVIAAAAMEREAHALWGSAPMWFVYHHTHKQRALVLPYFMECLRLRVPPNHDFATGPAKLALLNEEDGYLGPHRYLGNELSQGRPVPRVQGGPCENRLAADAAGRTHLAGICLL
jgi:hypothetical protein